MTSMYADYVKEREGIETLETEWGFATYSFKEDYVAIWDLYVKPDFRREGAGTRIADEVCEFAKKLGYKYLMGQVSTKANGAHESMICLLDYGMTLHSSAGELIYFKKDL